VSVKLYIEGGGDGPLLDTLFRQGWRQFFEAAGLAGSMPGVVRGQGRTQTFDLFATAVANPRGGSLPLLLVDSEDPVTPGHSVWQHLKERDNWERPSGAADNLADRDLLRSYFGTSLRESHFRQWQDLEAVPKFTVFDALTKSTAGCQRHYSKGKVSFEMLAKLSPVRVEAACLHAKALLDRLRAQ
jgi:hypothetical protein